MNSGAKEQRLRMTRQRRVILEEIRRMDNHPSAEEVYDVVRKRLPRIGLGTVYRNLEVLSELGEIQKLELGGTLMRFDPVVGKHYHIRCINCDRVDNAPMGVMSSVENALSEATDYQVTGHSLEFLGLCPCCMEHAVDRTSLGEKAGFADPEDSPESPD
jgi:Fe2+ or Zn2+ uptake regulation protein